MYQPAKSYPSRFALGSVPNVPVYFTLFVAVDPVPVQPVVVVKLPLFAFAVIV